MSIITSPIFVGIFLSAPVWLSLLGYATSNNKKVSRLFWSYALLALILVCIVFFSYDQATTWIGLFSLPGILVFPCSIVAAVITYKNSDEINSLTEQYFYFLAITIVGYFACNVVPGIIIGIFNFFEGIIYAVIDMFQNIISIPKP